MPSGGSLSYGYDPSSGFLSGGTLADGSTMSLAYSYDTTALCTAVTYQDPSGGGTHRDKTVYLTANVSFGYEPGFAVPQAVGLVRLVINNNDEVSYLNIPYPGASMTYVYEGANSLKHLYYYYIRQCVYGTSWNCAGRKFLRCHFYDRTDVQLLLLQHNRQQSLPADTDFVPRRHRPHGKLFL